MKRKDEVRHSIQATVWVKRGSKEKPNLLGKVNRWKCLEQRAKVRKWKR